MLLVQETCSSLDNVNALLFILLVQETCHLINSFVCICFVCGVIRFLFFLVYMFNRDAICDDYIKDIYATMKAIYVHV